MAAADGTRGNTVRSVARVRGTLFVTDRNLYFHGKKAEVLVIPIPSIRRVVPCRIQVKTFGVSNSADSGLRIEGCEVGARVIHFTVPPLLTCAGTGATCGVQCLRRRGRRRWQIQQR